MLAGSGPTDDLDRQKQRLSSYKSVVLFDWDNHAAEVCAFIDSVVLNPRSVSCTTFLTEIR